MEGISKEIKVKMGKSQKQAEMREKIEELEGENKK